MPVTSPLDAIPMIPPVLTGIGVNKIVKFINKLIEDLLKMAQESVKLPDDCNCDDPRIDALKEQLDDILERLRKLQELVDKIMKYVKLFKKLIKIASAVQKSLYVVPIIGQAVLMADLSAVQTMTIENAKKSLDQLEGIPPRLNIGVDMAVSQLAQIAGKIAAACSGAGNETGNGGDGSGGGDDGSGGLLGQDDLFTMPNNIKQAINDLNFDYNDLLPSEFYQDKNVSEDDLDLRSDLIKDLIDQQQDLLASLQEAPSQLIKGDGPPNNGVGKSGDYYLDEVTDEIYGPKLNNKWLDA